MMILSVGKPRKTYGLRLSEDEAARLDRVAAVFSVPRSAALRILIDEAANALDVLEARGRSARSAGEGGAE
jgi:hypothetical protein